MKILLIEDSRVIIEYVRGILYEREDVTVLPPATNGQDGVEMAKLLKPDLVLCDLQLPKLHGFEVIRSIMAEAPCPIIVLSAFLDDPTENNTFESLRAGAIDVLAKPMGLQPDRIELFRRELFRVIDASHQVQLPSAPASRPKTFSFEALPTRKEGPGVVLIGSSTGGLPVIQEILSHLPDPLPVPVVIAHHILKGFDEGFAEWLRGTGHTVRLAAPHMRIESGTIYLCPAEMNTEVQHDRFHVFPSPSEGPSPDINTLFQSALTEYGKHCVAILLSGMGEDGAEAMKQIHARGGQTLAQSGNTCVVNGMPEAARRLGAVHQSLPPLGIAASLRHLLDL